MMEKPHLLYSNSTFVHLYLGTPQPRWYIYTLEDYSLGLRYASFMFGVSLGHHYEDPAGELFDFVEISEASTRRRHRIVRTAPGSLFQP